LPDPRGITPSRGRRGLDQHQAADDLVHRTVSADRNDRIVPGQRSIARQLYRMAGIVCANPLGPSEIIRKMTQVAGCLVGSPMVGLRIEN
jgi:hypothetical protein